MSRLPARYPSRTPIYMQRYPSRGRSQYDALAQSYLDQDRMARNETESRYLDTLGGLQGVRERVTGDLADYGKSFTDDIAHDYEGQTRDLALRGNNLLGDMASRGLSGSSLRASVATSQNRDRAEIEKNKQRELTRANDAIVNRRVAADLATSNSIYGLMERRNDVQPNMNDLAKLSQGLGQAGYGPGAAGIYPSGGGGGYYPTGKSSGGMPWYPQGKQASRYALPGQNATALGGAMNTGPGSYGGGGGGNYFGGQPTPYQRPGTSGGYDDPYSSAIGRAGQRQEYDYGQADMFGYGGGYGPRSAQNVSYGGVRGYEQGAQQGAMSQQRQAPADPNAWWRQAVAMGADPWSSTPYELQFNSSNSNNPFAGNPNSLPTKAVRGWQQASGNVQQGQAILGSPNSLPLMGYGQYDPGGYGNYQQGQQQQQYQQPHYQPYFGPAYGGRKPIGNTQQLGAIQPRTPAMNNYVDPRYAGYM